MTPLELKVARKLLGLSTVEAAEHIGQVSKRSWSIGKMVKELLSRMLKN
ncbi:hypothetical protein [Haemophilus parainfluenzae]|uniref:Uncharacterized protein n=1 Tax=Haemophilus parainfluenzae TaxID=729 RepID=A0A377JED5_HAEPA|nr:hypothetical protein [Haemophilus parainfluenzae]STP02639.1 Uncharacterised protein [Haemophilus parainfluenzae]